MTLDSQELRHAQMVMLKILKDFDNFCTQHGLTYTLSDGSLIGAVRHNGFIPWDDDVDVSMPRKDYEKLKSIIDQLPDEYIFQDEFIDKGFGFSWGKVILKDTKWIEYTARDTDRRFEGIFIDIFPIDDISDDERKQNKQSREYTLLTYLILLKCHYYFDVKGKPIKALILGLLRFVSLFVSLRFLKNRRYAVCTRHSGQDGLWCTRFYLHDYFTNKTLRSNYSKVIEHDFEDFNAKIPAEFDKVLTDQFGSYMELPPPEKRINHSIIDYDLGCY